MALNLGYERKKIWEEIRAYWMCLRRRELHSAAPPARLSGIPKLPDWVYNRITHGDLQPPNQQTRLSMTSSRG